ncbi:hypothetical protein QQF64_007621 [Cirrhinus molitorella]|uniref:Uncharacterized protein n=1 Tax=Cirrhinus molitorella TaxID=172907 RepID=A0ABR3MBA8_9TELE
MWFRIGFSGKSFHLYEVQEWRGGGDTCRSVLIDEVADMFYNSDVSGSRATEVMSSERKVKAVCRGSEEVCYEAHSPDEAALIHAAKAYGFTMVERTPHYVTVKMPQLTRC